MKTYEKVTPITTLDGMKMLVENDGKPVRGLKMRNTDYYTEWQKRSLAYCYTRKGKDYFVSDLSEVHDHCARVESINPRDVPEGCAPLPGDKPWLAYVPTEIAMDQPPVDCWFLSAINGGNWKAGTYNTYGGGYVAIDVRKPFAKQHFPQIVEAMEYVEPDPFDEWWNSSSNVEKLKYTTSELARQGYELGVRIGKASK